jgi:hypothetical protein
MTSPTVSTKWGLPITRVWLGFFHHISPALSPLSVILQDSPKRYSTIFDPWKSWLRVPGSQAGPGFACGLRPPRQPTLWHSKLAGLGGPAKSHESEVATFFHEKCMDMYWNIWKYDDFEVEKMMVPWKMMNLWKMMILMGKTWESIGIGSRTVGPVSDKLRWDF